MDGFDISGIKSVQTGIKPSFEPFGKEIEVAEVAACLSGNLYLQLSDGTEESVKAAVSRAEVYIGTVLSYLGVRLDLDDRIVRQIVLMQTIYELHMALGHEEAGREYRIQAKNTIIAAYGSFPDADTKSGGAAVAQVVRAQSSERHDSLQRARRWSR